MVTFDDVRRLGLRLPEVTESTWYGTPGLKVRNKGFCRLWGEREHRRDQVHDTEVLVVFCEMEMKPVLLENHPDVLFTVAHYDGHGAVLVRLENHPDVLFTVAHYDVGYMRPRRGARPAR